MMIKKNYAILQNLYQGVGTSSQELLFIRNRKTDDDILWTDYSFF